MASATVTLSANDRDFILEHVGELLSRGLRDQLRMGQPCHDGVWYFQFTGDELDALLGTLSVLDDETARGATAHALIQQLEAVEEQLFV